jgi:protein MAK16
MRKLSLKVRPKLVGVNKKLEKREVLSLLALLVQKHKILTQLRDLDAQRNRETKALRAAKIENAIEKELLERLRQGTYGDIYNFPLQQYQNVRAREKERERAREKEKEREREERREIESKRESKRERESQRERELGIVLILYRNTSYRARSLSELLSEP